MRFRRSAAQRLVSIYSYTAYALQRAAPLQQNASILLGFGGTTIANFFLIMTSKTLSLVYKDIALCFAISKYFKNGF